MKLVILKLGVFTIFLLLIGCGSGSNNIGESSFGSSILIGGPHISQNNQDHNIINESSPFPTNDPGNTEDIIDLPPPNPNQPPLTGSCDVALADGLDSFRQGVCKIVNEQRAQQGRGPLTMDPILTAVAQEHAEDMNANNYFSHTSLDGRSVYDRMRAAGINPRNPGENIAWGDESPQGVMNTWMSSSGHRSNILDNQFDRIGVGYSDLYWVQTFTN